MDQPIKHPDDCTICRNWKEFGKDLDPPQPPPPHLYMKPRSAPPIPAQTAPQGGGGGPVRKPATRRAEGRARIGKDMYVSLFSLVLSLVAFVLALWAFFR